MFVEYIAHRVSGDMEANVADILRVCKERHTEYRTPFAPYLTALRYLDDSDPSQRDMGMRVNEEFFRNDTIDRIYVCGPSIIGSKGVEHEIRLAHECCIPIEAEDHLIPEVNKILPSHLAYLGQRDLPNGNTLIAAVQILGGDLLIYETEEPVNKISFDRGNRGLPLWAPDEVYGTEWRAYKHRKDELLTRAASAWIKDKPARVELGLDVCRN